MSRGGRVSGRISQPRRDDSRCVSVFDPHTPRRGTRGVGSFGCRGTAHNPPSSQSGVTVYPRGKSCRGLSAPSDKTHREIQFRALGNHCRIDSSVTARFRSQRNQPAAPLHTCICQRLSLFLARKRHAAGTAAEGASHPRSVRVSPAITDGRSVSEPSSPIIASQQGSGCGWTRIDRLRIPRTGQLDFRMVTSQTPLRPGMG